MDENSVTLCLCGCGLQANKPGNAGRVWKWRKGHRPKPTLTPCLCGCDELTKGEWVKGHHSRVNNISKRDDVREMRRKKMISMHETGIMSAEPWNKGQTVETDDRFKTQGESVAASWTPERRSQRSEEMKQDRLDGTIPTLRGPFHSQWHGGTPNVSQRMRGSHQLFSLWKRPILARDGFRCVDCGVGSGGGLQVHHDGERFADILHAGISAVHGGIMSRALEFDEVTPVLEWVVDYHIRAEVSGVTLCGECHIKRHENDADDDL